MRYLNPALPHTCPPRRITMNSTRGQRVPRPCNRELWTVLAIAAASLAARLALAARCGIFQDEGI